MIDYEWTTDKLTPQQIISRALNCYGQEDPVRMEHPIVKKHLEALGIGKEQMYELSEKELAFQRFVLQEKDGRRQDHLQSRYKSDSLRSCGAAVSGTDSWNRMARKSADAGTAGSVPVDERTGACRYPVPCSDGTV